MVPHIFRKTTQTHDTFHGKWPKILLSFSTATAFLSWKLPGSSTHTTAASQKSLYMWYSHVLHDCFGHFACVKFFANKIYVGFKVFIGATVHENWISWFNPRNISPTKISTSTVCTDCLHNYHQYITFDTQDQYTLWQTLCSNVYWHRSCAVSHVARPHPLLTFNWYHLVPVKWYHLVPVLYTPLPLCTSFNL